MNQLKDLKFAKDNKIDELDLLKNQKNQLEIEKKELEEKYLYLQDENIKLKEKFDEFKKDVEKRRKKRCFLIKLMN